MNKIFIGEFKDENDIIESFILRGEDLENANILFAYYEYIDSYNAESFVLFEKDEKLYEVNASHCSCYGLEGQWEPEETTIEELLYRLDGWKWYAEDFLDCQTSKEDFRNKLYEYLKCLDVKNQKNTGEC